MATTLEKFQKNIIGSQSRITDYVPIVSSAGDFSIVNNIQAILTSWNNILLTQLRTYVANPEYGSDLYKYIFEPLDEYTAESIKEEIQYRLMLFDDRALVTNIDITFMSGGHGFVADIDLKYEDETGSLSIDINSQNMLKFES
jgi:phage baseplate assembly protein W